MRFPARVAFDQGLIDPDPGTSMMRAMIRLLLVDDHAIVRKAFARLLRLEPDLTVIGEAGDGKEAVEKTRELQPDIVLMDINMPAMNGIEATRLIHAEHPQVRVIGLSMCDAGEAAQLLHAGAVAYINKDKSSALLVQTIRRYGAE